MASMKPYPPAWTGYKRSVTIQGNAYEELEYQFASRHRKITIHRRLRHNDASFRRRRHHRRLENIRSSLVNRKVISLITGLCVCASVRVWVLRQLPQWACPSALWRCPIVMCR